jgi:hypothetical protein
MATSHNLTAGARIFRADNGDRSPAVPVGSYGTVTRVQPWDGALVVTWDAAPGGTYTYSPHDARISTTRTSRSGHTVTA